MPNQKQKNPTLVAIDELTKLRFHGKQISLPPKKRAASSQAGAYFSNIRGRGMEFEETRQYQPGDDIRLMDWRVTARTGKPHTKVFRDERERPIVIVGEFSPSMYFGTRNTFKSCVAAKAAALIGWAAVQHGDRVGAILSHEVKRHELRPTGGQRGIFNLLNRLQHCANTPNNQMSESLTESLRHLRQVTKPGTMIFVISDFWSLTKEAEQELSQLTQHNDVFCVLISDPIELNHLPSGRYPVKIEGKSKWIDTTKSSHQNKLQELLDKRVSHLNSFCRKRRINLIMLSTEEDISESLLHQMGKR